MKKVLLSLVAVGLVTSCGQEGGGSGEWACSQEARSGTYWSEFETLSGGCGDIDSVLTHLSGGESTPGAGCEWGYSEWSEDECSLEVAYACPYEQGYTVQLVGVSRQESEDGGYLSGLATISIRDSWGGLICQGSYRTTAVRQ